MTTQPTPPDAEVTAIHHELANEIRLQGDRAVQGVAVANREESPRRNRAAAREQGGKVSDDQSATPAVNLYEEVLARFHELRDTDRTIRKLEREVGEQKAAMRAANQLRHLAEASIRNHEAFLKREAAAYVAKKAGVAQISGFVGKVEGKKEYRRRLREELEQKQAAARILIAANLADAKADNPS